MKAADSSKSYNPWANTTIATNGISAGSGVYGHAGDTLAVDKHGHPILQPAPPSFASPDELRALDEYAREKEHMEAKHRERMDALKTIFPRGYHPMHGFEHMVDIARENLTNPMYEQVLKEFEDAQTALHRAANKLATAVKMTDIDEVNERTNQRDTDYLSAKMKLNSAYGSMNAKAAKYNASIPSGGISYSATNITGAATVTNASIATAVGPQGVPGPQGPMGIKGDKGDPGRDAVIDENLLRKLIRMVRGEDK